MHFILCVVNQVLQIYGQRSDEVTTRHNSASVLCDLPCDIENPALLVTGLCDAPCDVENSALLVIGLCDVPGDFNFLYAQNASSF